MFGLFSRPKKQIPASDRFRARLGVERLEARDCPTGPVIMSLSAVATTNHMATLYGMISDPNPASTRINFSGVASGSVNSDATGHFYTQLAASSLGQITAAAIDGMGLTSCPYSVALTDQVPQIVLNLAYGANKQLTLSGKVTDDTPSGLTVSITGLATGTVTTDSNGNYTITVTASGPNGTITATTADIWGQAASAQVTASNSAPVISALSASASSYGFWSITGKVADEHPGGLTLTFTSTDVPAINGLTTTVQADGSFSLTVLIPNTQSGYFYAQTTDWWGVQSNVDWDMIVQIISGGTGSGLTH